VPFCLHPVPHHPAKQNAQRRNARENRWSAMSALGKILNGIEIEIEPFALCELRGPGHLNLERQDNALLHYVLAGRGWIEVPGLPKIPLSSGSMAIVPANLRHHLKADESQSTILPSCGPVIPGWQVNRVGFGDHGLLVVCGRISASYLGVQGIFDVLRAPILAHLETLPEARNALEQLLREIASPGPGSQALARSLMLQCLILVLRQQKSELHAALRWLGTIEHSGLWPAIKAILNGSQAPHSLESLAAVAGMSRSAFAEHFKAAMGQGPMDFVREMRLRHAARLLVNSELPIKTIAGKIGYASRSYFSRAFQASYGMAPAAYRIEQQKKEMAGRDF
jgi:AraC-like DNA-binding protein